jgi:hypothetical protein
MAQFPTELPPVKYMKTITAWERNNTYTQSDNIHK